MTANIVDQVFAGNTHQVTAHIAHVIGWIVVAHVGINCGQALRHRTRAVHRCLVDQLDLKISALSPLHYFERGATSRHAAADDEDIYLFFDNLRISKSVFSHFVFL